MKATWKWARGASFGVLAVVLLAACGSQLAETRGRGDDPAGQPAMTRGVTVTAEKAPVPQAGEPTAAAEQNEAAESAAESVAKPAETPTAEGAAVPAAGQAAEQVAAPAATPAATPEAAPAVAPEAAPTPAPVAEKPSAPENAPDVVEEKIPAQPRFLMGIDVQKGETGTVVTLRGDGKLSFEYFLVEGKSLVVDIADIANKARPVVNKVDDAWLHQIRIGEHTQPKKATRVVFDLKKVDEYKVSGDGDRITVAFGRPARRAQAKEAATTAVNTVAEIYFKPLENNKSRLEIRTAVKPEFKIVDAGDPSKVVIEVANARIASKDQKAMDLSGLNREVVRITSFQYLQNETPMVRVTAQLRKPGPFHAVAEENRIFVDFEGAGEAAAAAAPAPPAPQKAAPAAPATETTAAAATPAATPATAPAATKPAATTAAAPASPAPGTGYTGRKLSLDFKDADVNDILRLISEVSGLNFVAGTEVKGTVSIKLADVPWDQALEIILKTNQPQLAQIRESENIVRITTVDKILDEEQRRRRVEEDKKKTIDAQRQLEPMITKSFLISYGEVEQLAKIIKDNFTSERGKVQHDARTKTIIVQDIAANIEQIGKVIGNLDSQTPGVLVEARIVEVNSDFGQQIGVQWNFTGAADSAHGNSTKYEFPNSINIDGTQSDGGKNYMVNLPATAPVAGVGMTFGHIANTLTLDLKLSAMEKMGRTKILSNPKVLVIQNQKAIINVGSQLPITKTDTEGNRTVEWKDVGIKLEVQPSVTNDKRVFMDIQVEKSQQGANVQTTEGTMFSIDTRRAQTKVLIADGETTVIGGIFQQETDSNLNYVPWLGRIPILGWLFKSKNDTETRKELMIFVTPRIVTL